MTINAGEGNVRSGVVNITVNFTLTRLETSFCEIGSFAITSHTEVGLGTKTAAVLTR